MSTRRNPPELKSVAKIKGQASEYYSSKKTKQLVKDAILKELNSHLLSIRPQKIHQHENQANRVPVAWAENHNSFKTTQSGRKYVQNKTDTKTFVQRHGQVTSKVSSKIPRRVKLIKEKDPSVTNAEQSKIQPHEILPGYEWHKKGRINELKIRFLARKFSAIWVKKVFGRVPPQEARRFYERKLMKSTFCVLEDAWWKTRRGWKLNIRAEYHNRYRLWKSCFEAWRLYSFKKKEKKSKCASAIHLNEKFILKKYLAILKNYYMYRIERRKEKNTADQFHLIRSQRFVLQYWKRELHQSNINRTLEREALSWWAFNLKSKIFAKWKFCNALVDAEKSKMSSAINHHNLTLLKRCFASLKSYTNYKRKKLCVKEFATKHYFERLMKRMVKKWYLQLQHQLDTLELQDRIEFMSRKFTLRAYFIRWQFYIQMNHDYRGKISLATAHYNQRLKSQCFQSLYFASNLRNLKDKRLVLSFEFRKRILLSKTWGRWLMRCERSEELKMYPQTKIARFFYRKNLLKRFLAQWLRYIKWRRTRKQLYSIADGHFKNRALPKYFRVLYVYKEARLMKQNRKLEADDFNRELMFAKYFYTWLKHSRMQQDFRMQERIAVLHYEEISKRKRLGKWRAATLSLLEEKRKEIIADTHIRITLKEKYFGLLKTYVIEENNRRKQEVMAVSYDRGKKLKLAFISWKKYTLMRRIKNQKLNVAVSHYQKGLSAKIIYAFKIYLKGRREIHKEVSIRNNFHTRQLLSKIFQTWRQNVSDLVEERQKNEIAQSFANERRLAEVFEAWKNFTALSLHERFEENSRVQEIRRELDKRKLQRIFLAIKEFKDSRKQKTRLKETATKYNDAKLKTKYLDLWKNYKSLVFRKLLLRRQSEVFYIKVNLHNFFYKWKMQHQIAVNERNRNNVVLWFWSKNVERKMFYAWKDYVELSKKKQLRTIRALNMRRNFMLEECLKKWIKYSADMISFRAKIARRRHLEGAERLEERVRKYALIWYNKARSGKHDREGGMEEQVLQGCFPGNNLRNLADVNKRSRLQNVPIVCKDERLQPRIPDYLRESFDLHELKETAANNTKVYFDISRDESNPRHKPPEPTLEPRWHKHPLRYTVAENPLDSITSSEDDIPPNVTKGSMLHPNKSRKQQGMILMPPSSFRKSLLAEKTTSESTTANKIEPNDKVVDLQYSPSNLDDDESSDLDTSDSNAESSHRGYNFHSQQIFREIIKIKEELENYKKQQSKLIELEKQCFHISSWLSSERMLRGKHELKNDIDFKQASELQCQIQLEIDSITLELNARKPAVKKLAMQVQTLVETLQQ